MVYPGPLFDVKPTPVVQGLIRANSYDPPPRSQTH